MFLILKKNLILKFTFTSFRINFEMLIDQYQKPNEPLVCLESWKISSVFNL